MSDRIRVFQQCAPPLEQKLTGRSERHPAPQASEQGGTQLGLKLLDCSAQRRLRYVQPLRGAGDVPELCDGDEVADQP